MKQGNIISRLGIAIVVGFQLVALGVKISGNAYLETLLICIGIILLCYGITAVLAVRSKDSTSALPARKSFVTIAQCMVLMGIGAACVWTSIVWKSGPLLETVLYLLGVIFLSVGGCLLLKKQTPPHTLSQN